MGEVGITTITSGIVQGTLVNNEIPEIIGLIWIPYKSAPLLEDVLNMAFSQLGEGNIVESRGNLVSTLKDDFEMLRQTFIMSEDGVPISGIAGTCYNPLAERIYLTFYLTLPEEVSESGL